MNKTANYQLNQWAKSDRVLMEDFNADNAKLDAVLKANASAISSEASARKSAVDNLDDRTKLHTILTHYQRETVQSFTVDLSGVNWGQWRQVYLCIQLNGSGSCQGGFNNTIRSFNVYLTGKKYCVIMTPLYDTSLTASGLLTGPECELMETTYTYGEIQSLLLHTPSGSSITSGTVILKGIK